MACSAQPVQENHTVKWPVRFSCFSFPSVLHMAAMRSSQRSLGFSSSQGSAELMSARRQSSLLVAAITTCSPFAVSPCCIGCIVCGTYLQKYLTDFIPVHCRGIPTGLLSGCS